MIKTFKVRKLATIEGGVREVKAEFEEWDDIYRILDNIFHYGQNDVQNDPKHTSVSVGDVIEYNSDLYVVIPAGFHKFTDEEYAAYLKMDRIDRPIHCYELELL